MLRVQVSRLISGEGEMYFISSLISGDYRTQKWEVGSYQVFLKRAADFEGHRRTQLLFTVRGWLRSSDPLCSNSKIIEGYSSLYNDIE